MTRYIYLLFIALSLSATVPAQRSWFAISPMAGATWQLDDSQITTPKTGAEVGLGITYQLQKQYFLMESGVEAVYNFQQVRLTDSLLVFPMVDTQGTPFLYKGLLYERKDASHTMALRIPLMFGAKFTYVYFLAGAKLQINLHGRNSARASLTTSGEYDSFYDDIINLPSHGFADAQPVNSYGDMDYNLLDLRPAIEVGTILNYLPNRTKIHLGIYAEYGVFNSIPREHGDELIIPDLSQYMQLKLNHVYATPHANKINNLSVGVRLKAFLQPQGRGYNDCHCIND